MKTTWEKLGYPSVEEFEYVREFYRIRRRAFRRSTIFVVGALVAWIQASLTRNQPPYEVFFVCLFFGALFTGLARAVSPPIFIFRSDIYLPQERTIDNRLVSFVLGMFFWFVAFPAHLVSWIRAEKNAVIPFKYEPPPSSPSSDGGPRLVGYIDDRGRIYKY